MKKKRFVNQISHRVIILLLTVFLLLTLTSCGEVKVTQPLGTSAVLEINNTQCSMGVALLRLLEAKEHYETMEDDILWLRQIGDITMADYVKNSVKDELLRYTSAVIMADNLTVFLNDEEKQKAQTDADNLISVLSLKYDLDSYGITRADAVRLYEMKIYYDKVFYKISENVTLEISEADTKVIEINYVKLPLDTTFSEAEELRSALKNSTDFRAVCEEYGYEPEMAQIIKRGDLPEALETVAYALRDDEISEVFQSKDGYFIIQSVEDYLVSESVANNNEIISNARRTKFEEAYAEFASESKMRFNDEQWDKIDISKL